MQEEMIYDGKKVQIITHPENYHINNEEDISLLENPNEREHFAVINRRFNEINYYFANNLFEEISRRSQNTTREIVRVLDIGGGVKSQAVADIGKIFKGKNVFALNVDVAHQNELDAETVRVFGDVSMLPIESDSIDVAYSRQLFPFLKRFHKQHGEKMKQGFAEIARVLAPGGIAFIDDEEEISGSDPRAEKKRKDLQKVLTATLECHRSNKLVTQRTFPRIWKKIEHNSNFLVLRKPE